MISKSLAIALELSEALLTREGNTLGPEDAGFNLAFYCLLQSLLALGDCPLMELVVCDSECSR